MIYTLLIKQCEDFGVADNIAREISQIYEISRDDVRAALLTKGVCIKDDSAEYSDAMNIKALLENAGAVVELESSTPAVSMSRLSLEDDDDEPGRILTQEEFLQQIKSRGDIFLIENEHAARNIQVANMMLAILVGWWFCTKAFDKIPTDFIPDGGSFTARLVNEKIPLPTDPLDPSKKEKPEDAKQVTQQQTEKHSLKASKKSAGTEGKTGGGGSHLARITKKGVIGILASKVTGKSFAGGDIFGKGGYADGIDAILAGTGGLKSGGSGGAGRRGEAGIGFGDGVGSGFGGNSTSALEDIYAGLLSSSSGLSLKPSRVKNNLAITSPAQAIRVGNTIGGRSKTSIMRVVMQNLSALRYAYNQRLRDKPELKGRITIKFAIDEFGKVVFCQVESSTIDDAGLEQVVVDKIKRWAFDKIDVPGDVTEVVYPFVFSM